MTNKLLVTAAAAVGLAFAAEAQTVSVGPRLGVNFATTRAVGGDDDLREGNNEGREYVTGAQFGIAASFGINEMFSIQPELLYSQKGFKVDRNEGSNFWVRGEGKRNYIELPVLGKLSFGTDKVQGFVTAGPYAGYWIGGKYNWDYNLGGSQGKGEADYEFSNDYDDNEVKANRLDIGASIGVGAAYRLGTGALNLDVRYGHGFSDDTKYKDGRDSDRPKYANRVIGVSVAYLFGVK